MDRLIRVFLVDDFSPFRDFLRVSLLQQMPGFEIVGEASDGNEAVQKIEALNPDVIILDLGLPNLNGLEVARFARNFSANIIILFWSQFCDWDIIEQAFLDGACGYVVKSDTVAEFAPAVESVCRGMQFISSTAVKHILYEYQLGGPSRELNRISWEIARRSTDEPPE